MSVPLEKVKANPAFRDTGKLRVASSFAHDVIFIIDSKKKLLLLIQLLTVPNAIKTPQTCLALEAHSSDDFSADACHGWSIGGLGSSDASHPEDTTSGSCRLSSTYPANSSATS